MKKIIILSNLILLTACSGSSSLIIPAGQSVEIDYPEYPAYAATMKNKSPRGLEVNVRTKKDNESIRGFGLGTFGKATIGVEAGNKLVLINKSQNPVRVGVQIRPEDPVKWWAPEDAITFTLLNSSSEAIPLLIPSVMNPNLSPNSRSGVSLKVGQKLLFRDRGKNYLLLEVTDSIQQGDEIDVAELLRQRKNSLGL